MNTLGIVPARGGSKRVPRKNLQDLSGKPLVDWVIEAGLGARRIDTLALSSDDDEILRRADSYPKLVPLRRPAELATDTAPAIDYVRHALTVFERDGVHFDAVVILQPSSPLTLPEDIDATVGLLEQSGAESAVSVVLVDHWIHPSKLKLMQGDRLVPYLKEEEGRMAAHALEQVYVRNCSVYVARRSAIERGLIVTEECRGYVMPRERSVDINSELDLAFARFLLEQQRSEARGKL
ncbi:MAG TPA: acylneuraminate cytidylyltransferase family protein [Polyangiaceae bacterium]|nr:acylneuraminate cytidylyltransferase family protein [Polyangiaceae bacterium]